MTCITIVSPGYPHQLGGVTDHTARLYRHWSQDGHGVRVWSDLGVPAAQAVEDWAEAGSSAVLIQYVPFLYGPRGVSRLPQRLAVAARKRGFRITTFVHEPWVPPTRLPWLALTLLQRRQLGRLVKVSDAVVTPVPKWAAMLGSGTQVVYVGSTLGDPPPRPAAPELPGPVVFSPFSAGLNWQWIAAAARAIAASSELVVIGATEIEAQRHPIVRRFLRPGWTWYGRASPPETLSLLVRARLILAPFVDGLTGRRTSAMAAASTGARLLSSRGPLYDHRFDDGPVALADAEEQFVNVARDSWETPDSEPRRECRRKEYCRILDARRLDDQLAAIIVNG